MARVDKFSLENFPKLKEYIDRVKAEQLSFRKYLIKEFHRNNYYTEKHYIKITEDGDIEAPEEFAPAPDVAAAIKEEIQRVKEWPRVIPFSERQLKSFPDYERDDVVIYRFHMRGSKLEKFRKKQSLSDDSTIIMLQVRYNNSDGSKDYKPWSYFDDGEWRMMEPDEHLPIFKPERPTKAARIMLHEGPKAAQAAQKIADEYNNGNETHPWAKELALYEHWGLIGGALAVNRCDFKEITDEKPQEVVYMCDNDDPGKKAIKTVSFTYGNKMNAVMFDNRWPTAWDIADPMPEGFFIDGEYRGPTLDSLIHPATWATKEAAGSTGKKKIYELTDAFRESWVFCVKPKVFINATKPSECYNEEEFNDKVKNVSHVKKTSDLLIDNFTCKVDSLMYDPSLPLGIRNSGNNRKDSAIKFNMHFAPNIEPKDGDNKIWLDYLDHMFPDPEDRREVMRWVATLIVCPEIKINYAMLLISEQQGVGKSTLASYILAPLIGHNNVSYPEETTIVDSRFTSWQVKKRLAIVNEIYAGHSYKAYNKLKSVITEKTVTVEEKYVANYDIDNWCHIFACSNDERAIKFAIDDRRWLVPLVTEKKWSVSNWDKLHEFLKRDGLGIIKKWAIDFIKSDRANAISRGDGAPMTRRKRNVYETMLSDGERLVLDRLSTVKEAMVEKKMVDGNGDVLPFFVTVNDLREMIKYNLHPTHSDMSKVESAYRIKKLLKGNGFYATESLVKAPGGVRTYLITNNKGHIPASFRDAEKQAKYIRLHSDDPNEVCLQGFK